MGETLATFGAWFEDRRIPYSIMTHFLAQLIVAVDYAHHRKVVHTGQLAIASRVPGSVVMC
jgi:serine/threonine-protein kinase SRPK3